MSIDDTSDIAKLKLKYPRASFMLQLGGKLVIGGKISLNSVKFDHSDCRNPRTAIGQKLDGTIVFFATDGRTDRGFTIAELAKAMLELGCVTAINCDGGGSSTMTINKKMVNTNENRAVVNGFFCYSTKELEQPKPKTSKKKLILLDDGHGMDTLANALLRCPLAI